MKPLLNKTCLSLALLGFVIPWPAAGQLSQLDSGPLIEALTQEGMGDLLTHLDRGTPPDDLVSHQLIRIAQLRLQLAAPQLSAADRMAAYEQVIEAMRALVNDHAEHHQRPVWQTDMAQLLLFDYLQASKQRAAAFYEFGVPTKGQRKAFESAVALALEQLADADVRFFQLEAQLPREPDHETKRVNTGLWARMMDEYYKTKTPYLLAHAAYYTALLGEDHPYYQNLDNPKIPRQQNDPQQERARLCQLAVESLDRLAVDVNDRFQVRLASQCLAGRALLKQGQIEQALERFDQIILQEDQESTPHFLSQLGKAVAVDSKGAADTAWALLADLTNHALVKRDLLLRLLVIDQMHRLKLAHAQNLPPDQRPMAIAQAYEPYEALLSDPALGEDAVGLKNYVYDRWESMIQPDQDVSSLPDSVLAAAGERARIRGQAQAFEAEQLEQAGQPQPAAELFAQAKPKLERAVAICTALLKRENLTPRVRANTMFNLGWAQYLLAQGDPLQTIDAAILWGELAGQMPDQPIAEEAIKTAITVLRHFHTYQPKPHGAAQAYEQVGAVLFEHFPTSAVADDERVNYAFYVLAPKGEHAKAVEILSKAPKNHPLYFEARREMLLSLQKIFEQAQKVADKATAQKRLQATATELIEEAQALPPGTDPEQAAAAKNAQGMATLILADVAIANSKTQEALRLLEGFDQRFEGHPELIRESLSKSIVALAQAGQFGALVNQAKAMMDLFPDDAAAVIDGVLTDLTQRIDRLRRDAQDELVQQKKERMLDQAKSLAEAARMLSELLLDWAVRQKLDEDDLVPYKLMLSRAMRLSGQAKGALDILEPLLAQTPGDTDLIYNMGETLFEMGGEQSLIQAAEYYDRLIGGLGPPYPPVWWGSWVRRLQIMDQLNASVADIPLRVRALELTDPNLGGEPYRTEFKRLQTKHATY